MTMWRTALILALCALLGVTGQAMAVAGANAPAEGRVVICHGHGSAVIYVDAEGQPTTPPELCIDCLSLFSALSTARADLAAPHSLSRTLTPVRPAPHGGAAPLHVYSARAPPVISVS